MKILIGFFDTKKLTSQEIYEQLKIRLLGQNQAASGSKIRRSVLHGHGNDQHDRSKGRETD